MADTPVTLTPEEQAFFDQQSPQPIQLSPEDEKFFRQQVGELDPIRDLDAKDIAELARKDYQNFSILGAFNADPTLQQDPATVQKIADAYHDYVFNTSLRESLPTVPEVAKTIAGGARGLGKNLWNYATLPGTMAIEAGLELASLPGYLKRHVISPPAAGSPEAKAQAEQEARDLALSMERQALERRGVTESAAGTEAGATGLAQLAKGQATGAARLAGRLAKVATGTTLGLPKAGEDYTPEDKVKQLFDASALAQQQEKIGAGAGESIAQAPGFQQTVAQLKAAGQPVRPEEVAELAAGDPLSWYAMGKGFGLALRGAGALVPGTVTAHAAQALDWAGTKAGEITGRVVSRSAKITAGTAEAAAQVAPVAGAVTGAVKGAATLSPVVGAGLGYAAGEKIAQALQKTANIARGIGRGAEEVTGLTPVRGDWTQLLKDIAQATPAAGAELLKGMAFDLGMAATAETPDEARGVGFGTAFGLLGAAGRAGAHILSGQIIAPREWGGNTILPSSGQFPILDQAHSAAMQAVQPGVRTRVNAIRDFIRQVAPGVSDMFLFKSKEDMSASLQQMGMEKGAADAAADNLGFFSMDMPGKDGQPRKVILARDIEAAPHESGHLLQDVLGEVANRQLDAFIQDRYANIWQRIAMRYVSRIPGADPANWQAEVLDRSNWGKAEAREKIQRDAYNELVSETGMAPTDAMVTERAEKAWADTIAAAKARMPGMSLGNIQKAVWRDILTPQEALDTANRYIAREVAAENFDALFKHGGPLLEGGRGVPQKLAQVAANLISMVGGEPLAGRVSETGRIPLAFEVTKRLTQQAKGVTGQRPEPVPVQPKAPTGVAAIPATPAAQQAAADSAKAIAANAPTAPVPGGTKSPRELLGTIAEAIAGRNGVKINYLSAPGEPAAATTSNRVTRRAIIEVFRTMPAEARALWEKTFFPERVLQTKGGKYQVVGWAPEVFAANAHKTAAAIAEMMAKDPAKANLSPYPIDPATKTFTPEGWKQLYADTQTFVANQIAGQTGAGQPLVVPKGVTERGLFAPATAARAGVLPQRTADFINLLFNFKLPEKARITAGKLPLNIAGQEVSAATLPGRVEPAVRPREAFEGPKAEALGIAGREIMEVNPLRAELERASTDTGVQIPSLIEAIQRLNLDNIKEVEHAPEAPQFRGNTLTLTAGFQPEAVLAEPEKDTIRLYSGRGGAAGAGQGGSWFSRDPQRAASFGPDVVAVDVPREVADAGSQEARRLGSGTSNDVVLPNEWVNRAEPVEKPVEQHIFDLGELEFQPSDDPRAVDSAATRDDTTGKIYAGSWHGESTARWMMDHPEWEDVAPWSTLLNVTQGFVTKEGEFLTRKEAEARAFELGQMPETARKFGGLESESFEGQRQFQAPRELPKDWDKIPGAMVSRPAPSYREAAAEPTSNPWVRKSVDPANDATPDNSNRVLLLQFSSDLINPPERDVATGYYDKLYSGARPGYARLEDFWEIPQWMGYASHFIPDADVYVVRDLDQARSFLQEAKYGRVAASALDVNNGLIKEIARTYPGKIDVGGYTGKEVFANTPNVTWHDSMEAFAKDLGLPYSQGVDYRHFQGSDVIPRLTMSQGCKHKCAFCTVEKTLTTPPLEVVMQQADAIAKLGSKLVYLNDKTFGQADNYQSLADVYTRVKSQNPDFQGFIVQTTASQLTKLPTEWLAKSGIKFVELGIESYNDPILHEMHKPATVPIIDRAVQKLRDVGITLIPNIIIGFEKETPETYQRTLDFLKRNDDIISHANIYNLAIYKDAELGKKLTTATEADFNENVLEKSFHSNPEVHRVFAGKLYGFGEALLDKRPVTMQFQPSDDPRAVKEAAFRAVNGKVYTGPTHSHAYDAASADMGAENFDLTFPSGVDGFVTNAGEFLTRQQAYIRGLEQGQYTMEGYDEAQKSEGFTPSILTDEQLEALSFDKARQFQPSDDPRAIKFAAVQDRKTGDVFTGPFHGEAETAYLAKYPDRDYQDKIDGFVTNDGEFLTRSAAYNRAVELNQITEATYNKGRLGISPGQLEVMNFNRAMQATQPPKIADAQSLWDDTDLGPVQFSPQKVAPKDSRKEFISAAAVQFPDGRVFQGRMHFYAYEAARQAMGTEAFAGTFRTPYGMGAIEGFVTSTGRFVDRLDAEKIAESSGQIPKQVSAFGEKSEGLATEDLMPEGPTMQAQPEKERKSEVWLIRHGATDANGAPGKPEVIRGQREDAETQLNAKGQREAARIATTLKGSGITLIVTSPLQRAVDTANKIAEATDATVETNPGLLPWHLGDYQGKPVKSVNPAIRDLVLKNPDTPAPGGGESFNQFKDRTIAAYQEIVAAHPDEKIAIATHYRVTKLLNAWKKAGSQGTEIDTAAFLSRPGVDTGGVEKFAVGKIQAQPAATDAGREAEKLGYKLVRIDYGLGTGLYSLALHNPTGQTVGSIEAGITSPTDAHVVAVSVDQALQNQGLGEMLYREMAAELQKQGVKRVSGYVVHPAPIKIRNKLFGPPIREEHTGFNAWGAETLNVQHEISPTTRFLPTPTESKKKQTWKLLMPKGGSLFSKGWILPDGTLETFGGGMWHSHWLGDNPDVRRKFGLDSDIEIEAVRKGFARVNYGANNGQLTIEAREKDWPHIAPSVQKIVEANLDKIDNLKVTLFDAKVKAVVDSASEKLFEYPKDERMNHLPFISLPSEKTVVSPQATPGALTSETALEGTAPRRVQMQPALDFSTEDTLLDTLKSPGWAVLTATQEKLGPATNAVNVAANEKLAAALEKAGFKTTPVHGFYKGVDQGVNFIVEGMTPKEALEWGKKYGQESVLIPQGLLYMDEMLNPVNHENTVIGPEAEKLDFYSQVPGGTAFSMGLNFGHKIPFKVTPAPKAGQATLPGFEKTKSVPDVSTLTKQEIADTFPEAVLAKTREEPIPSEIVNSPLAKANRGREVEAFADKLVQYSEQAKADMPEAFDSGASWYSEFVPKLKKAFGKDTELMAELLAATSPNTPPETNFAFAFDAYKGYRAGRFDKQLAKFEDAVNKLNDGSWESWLARETKAGRAEGESEAAFMAAWINRFDLKPRQSNGKLYGMHSTAVLQVLAGVWLAKNRGLKTNQFLQNLLGVNDEATIDVWADRTMRRAGYEGFKDRWRILPMNATGVSDADFVFSQKAFRAAADKLNMKPSALQGALWFAEKQRWADNGWGRLDFGDFRKEIEKTSMLESGIQQRLAKQKALKRAKPATEQELFVEPRPRKP